MVGGTTSRPISFALLSRPFTKRAHFQSRPRRGSGKGKRFALSLATTWAFCRRCPSYSRRETTRARRNEEREASLARSLFPF